MSLFPTGGPLNMRRTSGDMYEGSLTLEPGADGLLARECPDETCTPGYFRLKPGTGISGPQEKAYCPYCAKPSGPRDFTTKAQMEYAKAVLIEEAKKGINEMVRKSFGLDSSGKKRLAGGFINIDMKLQPMRVASIRRPLEEELRRDLICAHCGLAHAVFGLASWCPDCGRDTFLQHVHEELAVVRKILGAVPQRMTDLGARVAARDVENALEDVVSIFETVMKLITRRALAASESPSAIEEILAKRVRNAYQGLRGGKEVFAALVGHDLLEPLSADEASALAETFEKRHPITHNLGVVDRKYLERAAAGHLQGREVRVTAEEVESAINLIERVLSAAYAKALGGARDEPADGSCRVQAP